MTPIEELAVCDQRTPAKTILIVEDDDAIGAFLQQAIELETGQRVLVISSPLRAVEVVRQVKPDLMLLDYYLPPTTGIALYDQLQALDGCANVPTMIITVSLAQHQREIEQRQLVGMSKPFDLDELLHALENMLAVP